MKIFFFSKAGKTLLKDFKSFFLSGLITILIFFFIFFSGFYFFKKYFFKRISICDLDYKKAHIKENVVVKCTYFVDTSGHFLSDKSCSFSGKKLMPIFLNERGVSKSTEVFFSAANIKKEVNVEVKGVIFWEPISGHQELYIQEIDVTD